MFKLFAFFVSTCFLVIKSEDSVIKIDIRAKDHGRTCSVAKELTLVQDNNFTLEVTSDYFIIEADWEHKRAKRYKEKCTINYERTRRPGYNLSNMTFIYTYSTHKVNYDWRGNWTFKFTFLIYYDPWSRFQSIWSILNYRNLTCVSTVKVIEPEPSSKHGYPYWAMVIIVPIIGILFVVQSVYIIVVKIRGRASQRRKNDEGPISPKTPKVKRFKPRTNTADRPPLPLPLDEIIKEEPRTNTADRPPLPLPLDEIIKGAAATAPPMPAENIYNNPSTHGPLVSQQLYKNEVLDDSGEEVRSPNFSRRHIAGPVIPEQSYRNKCLDIISNELIKSPGFSRKQMEEPSPRLPPMPPEKMRAPPYHPAIRQENPTYDDEWQYEALQPSCRYLY